MNEPPAGAWPAQLHEGPVGLRPMRYRDRTAWLATRQQNAAWLAPWDATAPDPESPPLSFRQMVRRYAVQARHDEAFPWVLTVDGALAGQVSVAGVVRGAAQMANIGYWISEEHAGRGVMPTAVAMAVDHCFFVAGLHRIEVNIRPENQASLRVVDKLGLRYEGVRERYLHIAGDWRDHHAFAITAEELDADGLLGRWRRTRDGRF